MTINLTPEQESRLQAIMSRGAYASVDEVVEAALTAVEQRTLPGFAGTPDELDILLSEGVASKELAEADFWNAVNLGSDGLRQAIDEGDASGVAAGNVFRRARQTLKLPTPR